jgi:hypothetical protein
MIDTADDVLQWFLSLPETGARAETPAFANRLRQKADFGGAGVGQIPK